MNWLKNIIFKAANKLIIKEKGSIFIEPLSKNLRADKYDIMNFTSDTALSLINYWIDHPPANINKIFLIINYPERIELYNHYTSRCTGINFYFLQHYNDFRGIKKLFIKYKNIFLMFKCRTWIFESIGQIRPYSVIGQHQFVLGYFASCKSNYIFDNNISAVYRKFCSPDRATVFSTSSFDSMAKSAAFGVPMNCFLAYGMSRNDYLYSDVHDENALNWLESVRHNYETKIVLYAPTFRDYENKIDAQKRSIWGHGYDDETINRFLKENNIVVIAKLHAWQNNCAISFENKSIILYQPNFDFSFYELMKFANVFITDYSSIGYDWLFMDKPIIYNLWDLEQYRKERGFAYEPYEQVCGGEIVTNTEELLSAINIALKEDIYADKRRKIKDLMFTVQDFSSAQKVTDVIETYLEREK